MPLTPLYGAWYPTIREVLMKIQISDSSSNEPYIQAVVLLFGAVVLGYIAYLIVFGIMKRWNERTGSDLGKLFYRHWRSPLRVLFPLLLVIFASPSVGIRESVMEPLRHLFNLLFIGAVAWFLASSVYVLRDSILTQYDVSARDNLKARAIHTQINVLVKILLVVIAVFAASSMLMTFERVRQVGVSILASAGVIGIIVGFAAQKSIATLFAGIQIAVTQPIRIDDVVIVEGEWGRIEEVTLTYVVVRIWDLRRLVLPITYFLDKPFQNWTRVSADLLGTVFIYADYTVPVQAVREELERIVKASPKWDGKVCGLQVTNSTDRTVELRALMSANDASLAWDLRCEVREKLLAFLQTNHPGSLPRIRADLAGVEGALGRGNVVPANS